MGGREVLGANRCGEQRRLRGEDVGRLLVVGGRKVLGSQRIWSKGSYGGEDVERSVIATFCTDKYVMFIKIEIVNWYERWGK